MPGKILLIEDEPSQLLMLKRSIAELGHAIKTRDTLKGGIFAIRNWAPDLVLMDLHLPDGNSLKILEMFQNDPRHKNTVFILISSNDSQDAITSALQSGALDFIIKPFHPLEMKIRVQNWMRIKLEADQSRRERELFGRFVSKDVASSIMSGTLTSEIKGDIVEASVLFFDLRGSTTIAESLEPDLFARFLTELFTDISDIIFGNKGSVNKFMGDGLLCTFGIPQSYENNTRNSVRAAMAIRTHIENYNQNALPDYIQGPISYGIGISTGKLFAGNFGSVHKIEYAVLGDPVNVSARLESLTKKSKCDILLDGATRDQLGSEYVFQRYEFRSIRGKIKQIRIYGIVEKKQSDNSGFLFFND